MEASALVSIITPLIWRGQGLIREPLAHEANAPPLNHRCGILNFRKHDSIGKN